MERGSEGNTGGGGNRTDSEMGPWNWQRGGFSPHFPEAKLGEGSTPLDTLLYASALNSYTAAHLIAKHPIYPINFEAYASGGDKNMKVSLERGPK